MVPDLVGGFRAISLDALDERAALQRRVDNTYLVALDVVATLTDALCDDHEVLEIDGHRVFEYESVYFDTPALDCFHDHVADRKPRYKMRTRYYATTGSCVFEVKVKQADGETVKRHVDYPPEERRTIRLAARKLLAETLEECGVEPPGAEPRASLITRFRRVTLAAEDEPERVTIDFDLALDAPEGPTATLGSAYAIIETKTPDGDGPTDQLLEDQGVEPVSLSKYRLGIGLLVALDDDRSYASDIKPRFAVS